MIVDGPAMPISIAGGAIRWERGQWNEGRSR